MEGTCLYVVGGRGEGGEDGVTPRSLVDRLLIIHTHSQMNLSAEPLLITLKLREGPAKALASRLSTKFHLDAKFYSPFSGGQMMQGSSHVPRPSQASIGWYCKRAPVYVTALPSHMMFGLSVKWKSQITMTILS